MSTIDEAMAQALAAEESANGDWIKDERYRTKEYYSDTDVSIDMERRTIGDISENVSTAGENNAQYISFMMDRYVDGVDLKDMTIQIQVEVSENVSAIDGPVNVYYNESKIRFGWAIPSNVAQQAATIEIIVFCTGVLLDGKPYTIKTLPLRYTINDTLNIGGSISQPDENWYLQFVTVMDEKVTTAVNSASAASESLAVAQDIQNNVNQSKSTVQTLAAQVQSDTSKAQNAATNAEASASNASTSAENAKKYSEQAFNTTPAGYEALVEDVDLLKNAIVQTSERNLYGSKAGGIKLIGISGASEQKQYSGKQLIPYPYSETTHTDNGIEWTDNGYGTIKANGKSTATSTFNILLPTTKKMLGIAGKSVTLSGNESADANLRVVFFNSSGTSVLTLTCAGKDVTGTIPSDATYSECYIGIASGKTINTTFKPMLRYADIVDDTHEPYVGGVPAPSPSYPQEIEVVGASGSIEIKSIGKNFIPYPHDYAYPYTNSGVTFDYDEETGYITANGTANSTVANYAVMNIQIKNDTKTPFYLPIGRYKANGCPSDGGNGKYRIAVGYTNESGTYSAYGTDDGNGFEFEVTKEKLSTQVQLCVYNGYTANNLVFKPMILEADIVDDTYEQYKESKITISTPTGLAGIPVDSDGNYTDENGQQWICDEIVKYADGTGKRIQRIGMRIQDGTTNKAGYCGTTTGASGESLIQINLGSAGIKPFTGYTPYMLCDKLQATTTRRANALMLYPYSAERVIPVFYLDSSENINSLDEANAWLQKNPLTTYYVLAEPIVSMLSNEEVIALLSLKSFDTVTHISTDSELQPVIDLEYGTSKVGGYTLDALNTAKRSEIKENANAERLTALEALITEATTETEES